MKRVLLSFLSVFCVGSCATTSLDDANGIWIDDYEEFEANAGNFVTVKGYVSFHHEATGLYLFLSDMAEESNGNCLLLTPMDDLRHGERVVVSGILERTGCGAELICTNLCADYVLNRQIEKE